jgi:hypothetical protein
VRIKGQLLQAVLATRFRIVVKPETGDLHNVHGEAILSTPMLELPVDESPIISQDDIKPIALKS